MGADPPSPDPPSPSPEASAIPAPGALVAERYRVGERLGEGGMGVVLAVHDERTGRDLALKLLTPLAARGADNAARFFREARAAMRIDCEHVVRVLDVGESAEGPYMLMERLVGVDLARKSEPDRKFPPAVVARWLIEASVALAHAHARGIVHRDVKLSNLFLADRPGRDPTVKVLDFGVSKVVTREEWERTATLTGGAALVGSPQTISPEQLRDPRDVDARADVWSLGVMWFEALTGKLPYTAETPLQMIGLLLSRDPLKLSEVATNVPLQLARVVEKALQRDRTQRWSTIDQFTDALRACFPEGAFGASPDSTGQLRAITRNETIISAAEPATKGDALTDEQRDERAMMLTVDASAAETQPASRAQETLPARPSSRKTPAESPTPSAPRVHDTLAAVEQPKPRARPAWLVGASAMALAGVVAVVAVGASRRAPNDSQQAVSPLHSATSATVLDGASAIETRTTPPVVQAQQTQAAPQDAGAPANARSTAVNTASTRTRTNATTPATNTRATNARTATTTATTNSTTAPAGNNAQGGRVRVMGW